MIPFTIRPFETPADHVQCEHIQAVTWSREEVVPTNITIALTHHGALALGAFAPDGTLIGVTFSFLSPAHVSGAHNGLSHHSHMAAVLPEYRGQGIGEALKREQAKRLLAQGINLVTWTYDPLEAKNANLNINKLGCICRTYIENCYGDMHDELNAGLPSDRFEVEWWLDGQRAESSAHSSLPSAYTSSAPLTIAIPLDFQALKKQDLGLAKAIRLQTRAQFQAAFADRYVVINFERTDAHAHYTLIRMDDHLTHSHKFSGVPA